MSQISVQVQRLLENWTDDDFSTASRLLWQAGLPSRMLQLPPDWWDSSCAIDSGLWLVRERSPSARIWLVNQNDATLQLTWQPIGLAAFHSSRRYNSHITNPPPADGP